VRSRLEILLRINSSSTSSKTSRYTRAFLILRRTVCSGSDTSL
jgi:hypothetical protein